MNHDTHYNCKLQYDTVIFQQQFRGELYYHPL